MGAVKNLADRLGKDPWGRTAAERREIAELKASVNAEWRARKDDPVFLRETAAILREALDYGFEFEALFGTYIETETVGFDDRPVLAERRGLKVFSTARGGYIEESQLRDEVFELPRDTIGFHVSEHEDKLEVNFADTMEDMIRLGTSRLDAETNRRLFGLLQTAVPIGGSYSTSVNGLATTGGQTALNAALAAVRDAVQPMGVGRLPVTIIGRTTMVDQISSFTGFGFEALEEIRQLGRLGTYRGANIVQVLNHVDEDGVSYIPANELWVMAGNVGKFVTYGPTKVRQWMESGGQYMHYTARRDVGGLVHHPERARRVVDTSIPA
ncbi:MAG: hypothetical protein ACXVYY_01420 [Oryzihumus sp.]